MTTGVRRAARRSTVLAVATAVLVAPTAAHAALDDRLVVVSNGGAYDGLPWLQTLGADGSDKRDLAGPEPVVTVRDPQWAPDASAVAALVLVPGDDDIDTRSIRVFAQDGSGSTVVARDPAPVPGALTWTNDSSHVAYVAGSSTATQLGLVRRDGSARALLDTGRSDMSMLQWSPDGGLVTFASRTPDGAAGLFAVHPDGSGLRLLAPEAGRPEVPNGLSWSPEGDRFVYARNAPENQHTVVVVGRDGTVQRELATGRLSLPVWSPDGRSVAWARDQEIVVADPDTGAERVVDPQIEEAEYSAAVVDWSPDSRHLNVAVLDDVQTSFDVRPFVVDVETGEARELDTELADNKYGANAAFAPLPTTPPAIRGTDRACSGAPSAGFTDTAGSVFAQQIDCLAWYDVARGTSGTTYAPGATVTRAQMALFMTRMAELAGRELDPSDAGFEDLAGLSAEARDAVNAAYHLVIAQGVSEKRFAPFAPVTRAQMAAFLSRLHLAAGGEELGPRVHCFGDVSASVHRGGIEHLCGAGIASGVGGGSYLPGAAVTRAQMAGFLARLLDVQVEAGLVDRPE